MHLKKSIKFCSIFSSFHTAIHYWTKPITRTTSRNLGRHRHHKTFFIVKNNCTKFNYCHITTPSFLTTVSSCRKIYTLTSPPFFFRSPHGRSRGTSLSQEKAVMVDQSKRSKSDGDINGSSSSSSSLSKTGPLGRSKLAQDFELAASHHGEIVSQRSVDDLIFDMFQNEGTQVMTAGKFLCALEMIGLKCNSDQRLKELHDGLVTEQKFQEAASPKHIVGPIETLELDRETFKKIITPNIVLISRAIRKQLIFPEFSTFCGVIKNLYHRCAEEVNGGRVARYIPQLARVDSKYWGVSICTTDGQRYAIGDTTIPYTIQSSSKPLTYALALDILGSEIVHEYVGQEPSGRNFNELVLDLKERPHNPMVNAGAIIICSLLKTIVHPQMSSAEKFDYTQNFFKRLAGGEDIGFNNAVYLSEKEASDRNYALGYYMREHKCFPEGANLHECMDYYFQCCSMELTCQTAAVIASTLANGGVCPTTGERVIRADCVRDVLSLMHSCGMYDYSGQFAFKIGLPAKSGVSGAILLVVPNVLGMATFSPPLDNFGNPVRGVAYCESLVKTFNFHKYDGLSQTSTKIDPRRQRHATKGMTIVNLLFSAASGDVTSMRRYHLMGLDMGIADYDGRTALHLAAAEGHKEVVEYLLRLCHVRHNPADRWGFTPLDDAIRFGHTDVVEFLEKWVAEHS